MIAHPNYENNDLVMPQEAGQREQREAVTLKNGAIYTGEWLNGMRDGFGSQKWPDGSRYEGFWINDKANG